MLTFKTGFYEKLFGLLDNNSVFMRVDSDGRYYPIWCSQEFTEMIEGTEEDFIRAESGGSMRTIHPDDRDDVAYLFKHHVAKDGTNRLNIRKQTLKGNWIWVCVHYAFTEEDGVQYAYCSYFDVTELKESQRQTQAMYDELNKELVALSNDSLAALRSNLTKGIVEEVHGRDLYDCDRAGAKIEELISVRMANMPIESDRENYVKVFDLEKLKEKYYRGEGASSLVIFSRRQSGRQCFIKYSAAMRKDPVTGDVIVLSVETEYNSETVTEVLNNKVLAKEYDMVTYLVDGNYGVVIGDPELLGKGSIFPKKKNGKYLQYIKEQVIPAASPDVHDKDELLKALSPETIERKLEESEPYTIDVTCDIGGEIYIKRFMFYVVDSSTRFYILLKSDITDVIREQKRHNDVLAQALEEAKQANIAKTAFLSNMSHEIRTPMNAIIGLDNIALNEDDLSPATRETLEKINGSAQHLLGLINDILDMSRIESGRMVLKSEEFSFRRVLEQINTMINGQCGDKGLNYDCRLVGKFSEYYIGDDMKLKQVIINILGNAVKFTPEGGTVTFIAESVSQFDDKCVLRFIMRDTGIGMDESYLPKIFEPFSQENSSASNKYGSTGLGMAITKNIVEMMNGEISVKSKKGEGTEFTVSVTLKACDRTDSYGEAVRPQDMRVLVIDDDPIDCEHARIVLEEMGITPDTALSGAEAVENVKLHHARREAYNLILVDLKMPEQNGIEVTKAIRDVIGDESAIILLTAYSWEDVAEDAEKAGIDGFMAKPLFAANVMSEFERAHRRKNVTDAKPKEKAELNGRRVLVAEDVMINAQIMKKLLSMKGMTADHAENGRIAVDMFSGNPEHYYDAILMDVRMPVMDGLTAAAEIRKLERPDAGRVPIIAMTANAFDEDVQLSLQAGMTAHLTKPVEPERLYETLSELIADN